MLKVQIELPKSAKDKILNDPETFIRYMKEQGIDIQKVFGDEVPEITVENTGVFSKVSRFIQNIRNQFSW